MEVSDETIDVLAASFPGDFAIVRLEADSVVTLRRSEGLHGLFGMDRREYADLVRDDPLSVVFERDRPLASEALASLGAGEGEASLSLRLVHKAKLAMWSRARVRVVGTQGGSPVAACSLLDSSDGINEHSQLLGNAGIGIYVIDVGTHELLYVNDHLLEAWGRSDYPGRLCHEFVNGFPHPCAWCSVPLMEDGSFHADEAYDPRNDKWFTIDCRDVDWYGHAAVAVYSIDVTARKLREEHLEIDVDGLQSIIENIPFGIAVREMRDGRTVTSVVNPMFCGLLDITRGQYLADSGDILEKVLEEDRAKLTAHMRTLLGPSDERECVFRYAVGAARTVRWYSLRTRTIAQQGSTLILSCLIDLTAEREAQLQALQNQRMYEAAVEEARLSVWEYDMSGRHIALTGRGDAFPGALEAEPSQLIENVPDSLLPFVAEHDRAAFADMFRQVAEGAPRAACEVWYKARDDSEPRCERMSCTTVFDADGRPFKAYGISQDVTVQRIEEENYARLYGDIGQLDTQIIGSYRLNLTKNGFEHVAGELAPSDPSSADRSADAFFSLLASDIEDGAIRERFSGTISRERLLEAFREGRQRLSMEFPIVLSDGGVHWIENVYSMAQNPLTGDVEAVSYARDISLRVKDEAVVRQIAEQGYDFVGMVDAKSGLFEMLQLRPGAPHAFPLNEKTAYAAFLEWLGRNALGDDAEAMGTAIRLSAVRDSLGRSPVLNVPYRAVGDDGSELRKQLQFSWMGNLRREVLIAQTDVTSSYRLEQEQIRRLDAARRAQEHTSALMQSILDTTPASIFWKDADRRFEGANRAFLDFYGFPSLDAILGRNDEDMGWHPDAEPYRNDELAVIRDGVSTHRVPGICVVRGRERNIVASKSPRYERGSIVGLVGSFEDVTDEYERNAEIARLNDDLKRSLGEVEKANAAEQAFMSNLSHDIRTPLGGVLGFTELAMDTNDITLKQSYLEKIDASGKLMLDLVNDVLDMSKIESGKMELRPEPFGFRGLIKGIVDPLRISAKAGDVGLEYSVDPHYPRFVRADRLRLQQVILNLVSNAVKYTPAGGKVELEVSRLSPEQDGCNTCIRVSDNGIGMSREFQEHMFEPFTQEHQSSMYSVLGTGLGLTIVRQIVSLMSGRIEVESTIGKGSTFRVYLPVEQVETGAEPRLSQGPVASIEGRHLMLCEDNDLNAEIATTILRERAHASVERFGNGRLGLDAFASSAPGTYDAILMDLRMPVMDGIETTKAIRALDRPDARSIPIVAMTADAFVEDVRRCREAGMNAHVSKPVDPLRLVSVLAEQLAGGA